MQELLEVITLAYKKLSAQNIVLFLLLIKIIFCALGGLIVTYVHSKFSYKWLRNNFNIYVGITLPVIGLVITTVIGSNIALSIGMIGALSIVRFRTPIRTPYELVHYFSLLTIGISAKVDLSITVVLIVLLSILPYFIRRFSLIKDNSSGNDGKLSLNFHGLMKENDFKKITSDKNIRNYSVKNEGDKYDISGFMIFDKSVDKDKFLFKKKGSVNEKSILFCLSLVKTRNFNLCPFPKKLFSDKPIVAWAPFADEYPPPNENSPVLVSSTSILTSITFVLVE